ncbi:MAG: hypothetical protein C0179_02520, partial [Fervidicoccus sp.]
GVQIKKPIEEIQVVKVDPDTYNTLRSFVESSTKPGYSWNKGYKLGNKVIFRKHDKWILEIVEPTEELLNHEMFKEGKIGHYIVLVYNDPRFGFFIAKYIDKIVYELKYKGGKIEIEKEEDLMKYAIVADVLYARPIILMEVVEKIREYVEF